MTDISRPLSHLYLGSLLLLVPNLSIQHYLWLNKTLYCMVIIVMILQLLLAFYIDS